MQGQRETQMTTELEAMHTGGAPQPASSAAPLLLVALGIAAVLISIAVMRQMGLPEAISTLAAAAVPLAAVVVAGLVAPARRGPAFHSGGGLLGGSVGGMAAAASVAVLPGFTGLGTRAFEAGYDGLWPGLGVALGFVLAGVLLAPRLAATGAVTTAEAIGARGGGARAPFAVAVAALATMSLAAGLAGLSSAAAALLGLPFGTALAAGAALVLLLTLPGGMRSVTWAQAVAGIVIIMAVVVVAGAMSWERLRNPFAMLAYGEALGEVGRLEVALIGQKLADGASLKRHAVPYITTDALNFLGAIFTTALGLAAFPLLTQRAAAAPSPQSARGVMAGGLLALLPVIVLVPAIAVFTKLALLTAIAQPAPVSSLPQWIYDLGQLHALKICGVEPGSPNSVAAACGALSGHKGLLRLQDVRLETELGLMAAPLIGGGAAFLSGLAAAGLGAALLALCSGAAFAGGEAVARGLVAVSREQAGGRAAASRIASVMMIAVASLAALAGTRETAALAEWILPLSSVALFVPLLLVLSWRRASAAGAIAGMIAGVAATLYYLAATRYWPVAFVDTWSALSNAAPSALRKLEQLRSAWDAAAPENKAAAYGTLEMHARSLANWLGIRAPAAGLIGVPAGLAAGIVVSLLTPRGKANAEPPAVAGREGS